MQIDHVGFPEINEADYVLFVADIHIKKAWSAVLDDVVGDYQFGLNEIKRVAFENHAKLVILGGDIFDANVLREADMVTFVQRWALELHSNGVRIAAYPGNHDRVISRDGVAVKQFYEVSPEIVDVNNKVFTFGKRVCFAAGFSDTPADLAALMVNMPTEVNTVFLHQNLKGVRLPSFNFDEDEVPAGVAEIYVGDIHQQIQGQNRHGAFWAYPGPMFPQEAGEDKCGGLLFRAKAPRHGIASWSRMQFHHRPVMSIDATAVAPSDVLIVERIIADASKWARSNSDSVHCNLDPIVFIKILSSSREHVPALKAGIKEGSGGIARVVVTYEPPVKKTICVGPGGSTGVPKPVELVDTYFDTKLKAADGRYMSLRRAVEARALLRAVFTPGPKADTAKGRVLAYRSTIKSHLEAMP